MGIKTSRAIYIKLPKPKKSNSTVKIGFPDNSKSKEKDSEGVTNIEKAVKNEFGLGNTPPRPFMQKSYYDNFNKYKIYLKNAMKDISNVDKIDIFLEKVGLMGVNDVQNTIANWTNPSNAPSTVKKKETNDPLVDTSNMLKAVTYELKK